MSKRRKDVMKAFRQCREDRTCVGCPFFGEICDQLIVNMEEIPSKLLDMVDEELKDGGETE